MSSRWVCAACGGWCEIMTEEDREPKVCPCRLVLRGDCAISPWVKIDEEDEEQEDGER